MNHENEHNTCNTSRTTDNIWTDPRLLRKQGGFWPHLESSLVLRAVLFYIFETVLLCQLFFFLSALFSSLSAALSSRAVFVLLLRHPHGIRSTFASPLHCSSPCFASPRFMPASYTSSALTFVPRSTFASTFSNFFFFV